MRYYGLPLWLNFALIMTPIKEAAMAILFLLFFLNLSHVLAATTLIESDWQHPSSVRPKDSTLCQTVNSTTGAFPNLTIARRGCCSHHNGVCGCKGNRQECCDGTLSPTCRCFGESFQREKLRKTQ